MRKTRTLLLALSLGLSMSAYAVDPSFDDHPGAVVAFSANGGEDWDFYTQQLVEEPYVFEAQSGKKGLIVFNPAFTEEKIEIQNDFQLKGANFEIKTAEAQTVSFTQPLSNQGTSVTLTGSGTVETQGAAAFANITVDNGATMKVNSQIGVTGTFNVKAGGQLELGSTAQLLLTDQIKNDGFITLHPGSKLDASNLSPGASDRLGIQFEDTDRNVTGGSGFLYGGDGVYTTITSGKGFVNVINPETGSDLKVAQLQVGSLSFDIVGTEDGKGIVNHPKTDYSVWFQNGGESPAMSDIWAAAQRGGAGSLVFMATRGDGTGTTMNVDHMVYSAQPIVITLGTQANVKVTDFFAAVGALKVYEKAHVVVSGWSGYESRLNEVTFIGQGIEVGTQASALGDEFNPLNLLVENASSVTILSTVRPPFGYFDGELFTNKWAYEDHGGIPAQVDFKSSEYLLKGTLAVGEGGTLDLRGYADGSHYTSVAWRDKETKAVEDVTYQEEFAHLTMTKEGKLTVLDGGVLLISSVTDNSSISDDNLDTSREIAKAKYQEYEFGKYRILDDNEDVIDPNSLEHYTVNGTVEIRDIKDRNKVATITADKGEDAAHYTSRNYNFTVADADINVVDDYVSGYEVGVDAATGYPKYTPIVEYGSTDTTISNILIGDSVTNAKQNGGTVTLDNEKSDNYSKLWAKDGNIAITKSETPSVNAEIVRIGAGREVSVADMYFSGSLNVSELLQADGTGSINDGVGASRVDASLNLARGATLDVHTANGVGGIDMCSDADTYHYNAVTLTGGTLTLSGADYSNLWAMGIGEEYDLFYNVSAFFPDEEYYRETPFEITNLYNIDPSLHGYFKLCFSGEEMGGKGQNVGTVYFVKILPEPTTGTLSLLALAGLAARRRRK